MADVDGEFVSVSVHADVATITLQRPPMNAPNATVQDEIRQAAEVVSEDSSIGAVIVYGGPKVFAAGADIAEMSTMGYVDMVQRSRGLRSAFSAVAQIPQPTIAAITVVAPITTNNSAVGGRNETEPCVGPPLPSTAMAVTIEDCTIANTA